jgi:hypothetical protein
MSVETKRRNQQGHQGDDDTGKRHELLRHKNFLATAATDGKAWMADRACQDPSGTNRSFFTIVTYRA